MANWPANPLFRVCRRRPAQRYGRGSGSGGFVGGAEQREEVLACRTLILLLARPVNGRLPTRSAAMASVNSSFR